MSNLRRLVGCENAAHTAEGADMAREHLIDPSVVHHRRLASISLSTEV
jgi:hypothetical protein